MRPTLLLLTLAACIRDVPRGPDLGPCAELPEGVYTFGDPGIGTCLAGPADLTFFQQDGGAFLAVSNADPYRNFQTGSVLVVDWDDVAARIDAADGPVELPMDKLHTWPLPIIDDDDGDGDGGNPYLGGMGYLAEQQALVVTSRLTEGSVIRAGRDDIFFVDLSSMEQPGGGLELMGSLELEDDPFPVVVQPSTDRVYIGNLTDHSVSVLSSRLPEPPLGDLPLSVIDVAPGASVDPGPFVDVDESGSTAELATLELTDIETTPEDLWTLTYIDGSVRLLVPTEEDGAVGLVRWESGGGPYADSAWGLEEGLPNLRDPFVEIDPDGFPLLYFATPFGDIRRASSGTLAGEWATETDAILAGGRRSSPSVAPLPEAIGLWFDVRDADDEPARIGLASSIDNVQFVPEDDVLVPPAGVSYEDPYVAFDVTASRWRMWLSIHRLSDDHWTIGLSESDDGRVWSEPVQVLEVPGLEVAAPTVTVLEGRYGLWVALGDGTTWDHAESWSWDGWGWTDPAVVVPEQSTLGPSRVSVQVDRIGAWRVEGRDIGPFQSLLPAGAGAPFDLGGFEVAVTQGALLPNDTVRRLRADLALVPGTVVDFDGRTLMFVTVTGSEERSRIAVLEQQGDDWVVVVEPDARDDVDGMEEMLGIAPGERATSPVVAVDDQGLVMLYARRTDGSTRIHRATSPDGLVWTPDGRALIEDADSQWDSVSRSPHSLEATGGSNWRLWYTGDDGSRLRIGSATGTLRGAWTRELGAGNEYRMGTGLPGSFDDTSVKDPLVVTIGNTTHLYYAGFDGSAWHLGHATVLANGRIERRTDAESGLSLAAMNGQLRTFSALGVESPVLFADDGDVLELLYAGSDGLALRTGSAVVRTDTPDVVYAAQRFPTAGDLLSFETTRGGERDQVIELEQLVDDFITSGYGMSSLALDEERGFLYVTSKLDDDVYVVDIRDDSSGSFVDANYLDLEGLLRIDTGSGAAGFRSAQVAADRSLLFLTMLQPDGIVVVDLTRLVDNDAKEVQESVAVATLPLPDLSRDEGVDTSGNIGGAGMALTSDERLLLTTHFRGNGLSIYDLDLGAWGEEIGWIPRIGEAPHVVRVAPDGRFAVVANYVGEVDEGTASATLAVVDLDPDSDRFLEVAAWLVNQ